MSSFIVPGAFAVLLWWFATGIILYLDGLPPSTFRRSMGAATVLLIPVLWSIRWTSDDLSVSGACSAFAGAVMVWGWLEMSFLMGFITGPRTQGCADRCTGARHFRHATEAIAYNELATAGAALVIFLATRHQPNCFALWTFLILWVMRLSAKLNLFLGVPNLGEQFLPPHLAYLRSFFKRRPINVLFPFSVTFSTIAVVALVGRYRAAADPFHQTGYAALASLTALALIEHWFMVLPLPSERLWSWAMARSRKPVTVHESIKSEGVNQVRECIGR